MRTAARSLVLLLVCLAALDCRSRQRGSRPEALRTTLRVENRSFLDMNVYVLQSSQRVRLGRANGNSTTTLTFPANMLFGVTSLRSPADPIGANRLPISEEISVTAGQEIQLIFPP